VFLRWNLTITMILNSTKGRSLRLRVFAGPNGSGKSTVIQFIRDYKVDGSPIDFGHYINADDIAASLAKGIFSFSDYGLTVNKKDFRQTALSSGLIGNEFNEYSFKASHTFYSNIIKLKDKNAGERLAQILADYLRKRFLADNQKFSFETVFSHSSKLDVMREAVSKGYKVYLYFVSTESPEINKFRVAARKEKGGHDVPYEKIESRYYRSLDLLFEASQIAYQVFFFDNSVEGEDFKMFAHFKKSGKKKKWDKINTKDIPAWFKKYYSKKVKLI
jgi:predicted ABC-type ATPase